MRLPARWCLATFDLRVLVAAITLTRRGHNGRIDNLPAHGKKSVLAKTAVECSKQFLHRIGMRERLAIEPQRRRIRPRVVHAKPQKTHRRQPVAQLIFGPLVRQIIERLHDQRLEDEHFVPWLTAGCTLALGRRVRRSCAANAACSLGRNISQGITEASVTGGSFFLSRVSYHRLGSKKTAYPLLIPTVARISIESDQHRVGEANFRGARKHETAFPTIAPMISWCFENGAW